MPTSLPGRPRRIRAEMTATGWTYVLLSPFLGVLVVIDERALFLSAGWVALGLFHGVLARRNLAGLRLSLRPEEPRTRVGRGVLLSLRLQQTQWWGASRGISLRLRHAGRWQGQEVSTPGPISRQRPFSIPTIVSPVRFGLLFINAAEVSSSFPLGFYRLTAEWLPPPTATLVVWPRKHPLPAVQQRGEASAQSRVGTQVSPGIDVRPYRSGDPIATVCWKSSARTGRLHVRPREIHAHRARVLVVSSRRHDWSSIEQFWTMTTVACAILEDGFRSRTVQALQLDQNTFPLATPAQFVRAMDALAVLQPRRRPPAAGYNGEPRLRLLPRGKRGVSLVNEKGALVQHVA